MPRKGYIAKRTVEPDPVYGSDLVTKFVNSMMWQGKKSTAEGIFYEALTRLQTKGGDEALKLFKKAVHVMSIYQTFEKVREARRQRLYSVPDEFLVYMLEAFSYDWRGDLTKTAKSMMQKLRELQQRLRKRDDTDDQIAIAGHSTGGIIIRRMLGEPGADSLISHAFFLNVPFRGAPKALSVFVSGRDPPGGDPMIPGMDAHSMLAIAPTAPIVYHLAPSAKYPTPVVEILPDGVPAGPLPDREREKAALIDAALRRGILHPVAPVCVPLGSLEERLSVANGADDWNDFVLWRNRHSDGDALYRYESEKGGSVGETHFSLPAKKIAESASLLLQTARRISMSWSADLAKQAQTFHDTSESVATCAIFDGEAVGDAGKVSHVARQAVDRNLASLCFGQGF